MDRNQPRSPVPLYPRFFKRSLLAVSIMALAGSATANLGETLKNAATKTLRQLDDAEFYGFDITPLPDNNFALVWAEHQASGDDRIMLQRYDGQGDMVEQAFEVAKLSNGRFPWRPSVSASQNGKMVVAWGESTAGTSLNGSTEHTCYPNDISGGIQARLISTLGNELTASAISLPTFSGTQPCAVETAMDQDGDFALLWATGVGSRFSGKVTLAGQTFNNSGQPQSGLLDIESDAHMMGDLAFYSNNAWVVAYTLEADDSQSALAMAQRFDISGTRLGAGEAFRLDAGVANPDPTQDSELCPSLVGYPNDPEGGFVVAWIDAVFPDETRLVASSSSIRVHRWKADQAVAMEVPKVIAEFELSSGFVSVPSLGMDSDGNFLATWAAEDREGDDTFLPINEVDGFAGNNAELIEGEPIAVKDYSYAFVAYNNFQAPKVAMNDQAIMLAWLDGRLGEDNPQKLEAIFVPGLVEVDPDPGSNPEPEPNNDSGGALGWVAGLIMTLLSTRRWRTGRLVRK